MEKGKETFSFTHEFKYAYIKSAELIDGSFDRHGRHVEWKYFRIEILEDKTANRVILIDNDVEDPNKYLKYTTGSFIVKVEFTPGRNNQLMSKIRVLSFIPRKH